MNPRDLLATLNRVQKARPFKIAATAAVAIIAILVFAIYALQRGLEATESTLGSQRATQQQPATQNPSPDATTPATAPTGATTARPTPGVADASGVQITGRALQRIIDGREDLTSLAIGITAVAALSIVVIWLGLFLTHLAVAAVVIGVALPLTQWTRTAPYGWVLMGVASLAWAFNVGLSLLRTALSPPGPVFAVARNVLDEAVRLKLSLLFIVLLMFLLATLPMLLDPQTPLRYRVQAFLQYSTAGAFWLIALLTLLFGVSTVTLEQRDKIIWQTMTKPVAAWQYVLGKWLGVVGLNAILLLVCCTGVFLFAEYMRSTTAIGERSAYVPLNPSERITEDRLILETQILQARVSVEPPPDFAKDDPRFLTHVRDYIDSIKANDPMFAQAETEAQQRQVLDSMFARVVNDLYTSEIQRLRSVQPGSGRLFRLEGLAAARSNDQPLLLRYRIDAGSNMPDESYKVSMIVGSGENQFVLVEESSLGFTHAVPIAPVIRLPSAFALTADDADFATAERLIATGQLNARYLSAADLINPDGTLEIQFINGDASSMRPNPEAMSFPAGGIAVTYSAGSYRANFVRVVAVLWVKLAFLAMLAIFASTFLSFPVACLVAMGTFLAAESSGFLDTALETFTLDDRQNNPILINYAIYYVARAITELFRVYRELDPIGRIVDGRLLPWSSVAVGVGALGAITALLYLAATLVFRKRELATYSGQ